MASHLQERNAHKHGVYDGAYDALDACCAEHGMTMTALIEAIGLGVAHGHKIVTKDVVAQARRIDAERKSRRAD